MAKKKKDTNNSKALINHNIPKDVFETVPYKQVCPNGIIEDYDGHYSKSYRIGDTNFDVEDEETQENMVFNFEKLVNTVDMGMVGQLTLINRNIDMDAVRNNLLMKPRGDNLNALRGEWNNYLLDMIGQGKNNIRKEKIFTLSVDASNIKEADETLKRADREINKNVRKINHQDTLPMSIEDRLSLLYDIYNPNSGLTFDKKVASYMDNDGHLDFKKLGSAGLYTKNLVCPDSFTFNGSYFMMGDDTYGRVLYLDNLPAQLSTVIFNDLTSLPCNMIASATYVRMDQTKANVMMRNQISGIDRQISKIQSDSAKEGAVGAISPELDNARTQAADFIADVIQRDQRVYETDIMVAVFANSLEQLNDETKSLRAIANTHLCQLRGLTRQQEAAFDTVLPLAENHMHTFRILTTEGASVFIPFSVQDINQTNGICYGINPISNNMIRCNRKMGSNYNALVLGMPGSGKSFIVKEEIQQKFLNTDEDIIIIDPQGEYTNMVREFGGTIINLSLASNTHINPLDMDIQCSGDGGNPVPMKCSAIETLVEVMIGQGELDPISKSLIHRTGTQIYEGYVAHMRELIDGGSTCTCDRNAMPTLKDFYRSLTKSQDAQAQLLAQAIEQYCIGNYSLFAERTNVDINNRLICYDVSALEGGLKEIAMHVCLNNAWNTIISNGRKGQWTSFYIDEFHLFTKSASSAAFVKNIYKVVRKFHGMPTAITQNISDMFVNAEAETVLNDSSFIIMMNQSPTDRSKLQDLYNISPQLLEHITDQPVGNGLIYTGTTIVPFENQFPVDTEAFKLMDSRCKDNTKESNTNVAL